MQEGSDLAQHVNVVNQIITDLARLDVSIEDEDRAMVLLCSLPFSYEHLVTTLTYEKETIMVDENTAALLVHNQRKHNAGESSHGNSLYVKGHMKRDCPNLKKQADEKRDDSSKSVNVVQNDEDKETIRIVKGALTVMKGKITPGNIYKLLGSTVVGGVHSVDSCDDNTKLWHMRLGHLSESGMTELYKRNLLHGVKSCKLDFCMFCVIRKQTKKFEVFTKFKLWKAEVENQTSRKIKYLRSDNGTEYKNSQFQKFCEEHGIQKHFSVRKTPQQNGVAERMNMSLTERARCLRLNAGLPKSFWAEAVSMACYLINRSPRASLGGKVAEEVWTSNPVDFDHLRIFGCPAYVHVPSDERSKLDPKSKQCIFLGYKKGVKSYKF
ncbi:UNVERIFIED_CONTAM: Retrovirus-related Pol polyprotein from transposon TNT 1-94 [Sesamum latifolium]|uniref:Retrovirus-related Pol polyprotein from transposon TNT 1-94 n=1 Tax=Sesamum latifolium TaxID=2727402 RepID=A0AAW2UFG2_9LAMI